MKKCITVILALLFTAKIDAQCELKFQNEDVMSVSFVDYIGRDSCILQYDDGDGFLCANHNHRYTHGRIYREALKEIQMLLDTIVHNRIPQAEDIDINISVMKKYFSRRQIRSKYYSIFLEPDREDCNEILGRYQEIAILDNWLEKTYPIIDSGVFVINTSHDIRGMKIIIQTNKKTYYFDMSDVDSFQPYLMRTSDKDCLKFITNFNVNKSLRKLFKILKVKRSIPWQEAVLDSYIRSCAKTYRLF